MPSSGRLIDVTPLLPLVVAFVFEPFARHRRVTDGAFGDDARISLMLDRLQVVFHR